MFEIPSFQSGPSKSGLLAAIRRQVERPSLTQAVALVVAIFVVAYLDYVSGPFLEFGFFYNTVIVLACLQFGLPGLVFIALGTAGYLFGAIALDGVEGFEFRPMNAVVRAASFSVVGLISVLLHKARMRMEAHQRALETAASEREAVLQCLPDSVLITDSELRVRHVGGRYHEHLGLEASDLLGRPLAELPVAPEIGEYFREFAEDPSGHASARITVGPRTFEAVPAPVQRGTADFHGWVLVLRDVTDQVHTHELLVSRARSLAVQETRSRLARHLHDNVAQTLASVRMRLDLLAVAEEDLEARVRMVRTVQSALGQAIRDLRQTMWELRPTALEKLPFVQALQVYLEDLERHSGFQVRLSVEGQVRLAPEREVLLFYVVQEAVANAMKHSGSVGVDVGIGAQEDILAVEVRDDGVGFEPDAVTADPLRKNFGLQDMKDRARVMGADLVIRSSPGQGTAVRLSVPQDLEQEEPQ